jgi:hypothetical protein
MGRTHGQPIRRRKHLRTSCPSRTIRGEIDEHARSCRRSANSLSFEPIRTNQSREISHAPPASGRGTRVVILRPVIAKEWTDEEWGGQKRRAHGNAETYISTASARVKETTCARGCEPSPTEPSARDERTTMRGAVTSTESNGTIRRAVRQDAIEPTRRRIELRS